MDKRGELLKREGTSFPGKTYVDCLLKPVFNDQRDHFFHAMCQVHRAHVLMLHDKGILSGEEAGRILQAVQAVAEEDASRWEYNPRYEDLFFMVEGYISEKVGPDLAGNMHIARSRNDMGVTMYRLVLREKLLHLIGRLQSLRDALLDVSEEHLETVMPAYTHTQPAQPTTLGHYLLAVHDVMERNQRRLWSAFHNVNRSPLGAAALTTTGFDICRDAVKDALGFAEIVENSYDAIAGGDYLLETATSLIVLMTDTGRWIQDLLLYCTREFDMVRIADPYVQISSIMPQKRNPVSVEHSRSLASSAIADAQAVCTMVHNTPFGDIVDTEDDLQPHLYQAIEKCERVLNLMTVVIRTIEVNKGHLLQRAREGYITITELADAMVREKEVSFRKAHQIAAKVARKAHAQKKELVEVTPEWVAEAANDVLGEKISFSQEELRKICDPVHFVEVRKCPGGPNPTEARRMLSDRRQRAIIHRHEQEQVCKTLQAAADRLQQRTEELAVQRE